MDRARDDEQAAMSRTSLVLRRIAGSFVGSLVGSVSLGLLGWLLATVCDSGAGGGDALVVFFLVIGLSLLIGTIIGAAGGATVVQKLLKQRSSFWRALLGAFVGLLVGWSLSFLLLYAFYETGLSLTLYRLGLRLDRVEELFVRFLIIDTFVVAGAVIGSVMAGKEDQSSSHDSLEKRPRKEEYCQNCGSQLAGDAKTCKWCGADVN